MLELEWRESGGPEVRVPARTGFGSRLLQTIIPDGSVSIDYAPAGVVCHIHCSIGSSDRLEEEDL
jgi:two-component sensor histidine kinase